MAKVNVTKPFLRKRWDETRLKKVHLFGLTVGSERLFLKSYVQDIPLLDAVWSPDHMRAQDKRNKREDCQHIFISETCDVAVSEYRDVLRLLKGDRIVLVASKHRADDGFVESSKNLLKGIRVDVVRL